MVFLASGIFLSGNPARKRFASGRCFARYVAIEDPVQRRTARSSLSRGVT